MFDEKYGGFGDAPKFPSPHNLLFLLAYSRIKGDDGALRMAERTLLQMRRGGSSITSATDFAGIPPTAFSWRLILRRCSMTTLC